MSESCRQRKVQCAGPTGLHRMAYLEWGDPGQPAGARLRAWPHALRPRFRLPGPGPRSTLPRRVPGRGRSRRFGLADEPERVPGSHVRRRHGDTARAPGRGDRGLGGYIARGSCRHGPGGAAWIADHPAGAERRRAGGDSRIACPHRQLRRQVAAASDDGGGRGLRSPRQRLVRLAFRCRVAVLDRARRAREPGWLPAHALRSVDRGGLHRAAAGPRPGAVGPLRKNPLPDDGPTWRAIGSPHPRHRERDGPAWPASEGRRDRRRRPRADADARGSDPARA